jgi:prepilin-type N-terminal cleavage/methylation domain-containing protein
MFINLNKNKYNKGVTFVELMVVMAILAIMFATIIANYKNSRLTIVTQNLADDIALSIRKAQSYAIGVHRSTDSFDYGYGIHFSTNEDNLNPSLGSNKSFILFTDITNQKIYDKDSSNACGEPAGIPTPDNECLEILQITSGDKIVAMNLVINGNLVKAIGGIVDITFKRPSPEPKFCHRNGQSNTCQQSSEITAVQIFISNDANPGVYKVITISNTGQISVL